jgi:hypothetical protein
MAPILPGGRRPAQWPTSPSRHHRWRWRRGRCRAARSRARSGTLASSPAARARCTSLRPSTRSKHGGSYCRLPIMSPWPPCISITRAISCAHAGGASAALRDSGPGIEPVHLDRISRLSTPPPSPAEFAWGRRSAGPSSMPTGGRPWAEANKPKKRNVSVHLARGQNGLMTPRRASTAREPNEGNLQNASHQVAWRGNKRPHPSGRGPVQRHRDTP